MKTMVSVEEALSLIAGAVVAPTFEIVPVGKACGRVSAQDIVAAIDQPPFRASAMDGYAVRFADAKEGARLRVVGASAAGSPFAGAVGAGEAVRIFTGAAAPAGADHVVIQEETREETSAEEGVVVIAAAQAKPSHLRAAGIDFSAGDILKRAGARLSPIDLGLIAAANISEVSVAKRPIVAYFDNGDELREPGDALADGMIVGSNRFALNALIEEWGGEAHYLGRAADDADAIRRKIEEAHGADILVTIGGASVGDHDYVKSSFVDCGGEFIFSKIKMKPGKPTWFGRLDRLRALGLPGNPASAVVCAILFLRPLIALSSGEGPAPSIVKAVLAAPMPANGSRESYVRGQLDVDATGRLIATPNLREDSSLYSPLATGDCLIRRPADAPDAPAGAIIDWIIYRSSFGARG